MELIDGIIGAVIGAALTAVGSWFIYRRQKKDNKEAAATQQRAAKEAAATQQRNDIARVAHLLIVDFQSKVLKVAVLSAAYQNDKDVAEYVKQGVSDLITAVSNEKAIVAQLDQCCPEQKDQLINLESDALKAASAVQGDALKLFNVCINLSEGLSSIRRDLAAMIRE
jgi:hypothetical protein